MKHFYISLFMFAAIIAGSVASNIYTTGIINYMIDIVEDFSDKEEITHEDENSITDLKSKFYDNKNMLQYFINKEHIEEIEIDVKQLESAVKDKDTEQIKEKSIDAIYTLRFIKENLVAFD